MEAVAIFRLSDGTTAALGHGDLIGRLETAALHLGDPRISEAHAMVSLRGPSLKLLALRGRLYVAGQPLSDIDLVPGLVIDLADGLALTVLDVIAPHSVPTLGLGEHDARFVTGVCSLVDSAPAVLRSGFVPGAHAWFWPEDDRILVRRPGFADTALAPGEDVEIAGARVHVRQAAVRDRSYETTLRPSAEASSEPLEIVARFTSAHVCRKGERTVVIAGIPGRMLSELAATGVPIGWAELAREIWPDERSERALRARWDVNLNRLRKKLLGAGIPGDLVRSDGVGNVELCLGPRDTVRDDG